RWGRSSSCVRTRSARGVSSSKRAARARPQTSKRTCERTCCLESRSCRRWSSRSKRLRRPASSTTVNSTGRRLRRPAEAPPHHPPVRRLFCFCVLTLLAPIAVRAQDTPTEREAAREVLGKLGALQRSLDVPALVSRLTAPSEARDRVVTRTEEL